MKFNRNKQFKGIFVSFAAVITVLCLSSLLFGFSSHEGSHADLACTDCHLTQPDPVTDTIDTVDFFTDTLDDLCISCHTDNALLEQTNYCLNCHDTF